MNSFDREAALELVLDEAAERKRQGEVIRLEEYMERYPEIANEIQETLPVILRLEDRETIDSQNAPQSEALQIGQTLGDYELVRFLGRGGMGVVYEAQQISLTRSVALKILPKSVRDDDSRSRRFELEAKTAARLVHPHLVSVYDFGEVEHLSFYAMQFVDGDNLDNVIRALRKQYHQNSGVDTNIAEKTSNSYPSLNPQLSLEPDENDLASALASALRLGIIDGSQSRTSMMEGTNGSATSISKVDSSILSRSASQISNPTRDLSSFRYYLGIARLGTIVADVLAVAHQAGVLHRDIKPANLLLDRQGKIWVSDFGLAKLGDGDALTQSGDVVGTLRYMSPERFRGWSDPRSDIYALGATLFELVCFQPAFDELDRASLMKKIMDGDLPAPRNINPKIPRDLETIILKCLDKDPARRFSKAEDLRDDLDRFLQGRPIQARLPNAFERSWLFVRRNPFISGLCAALFILSILATFSAVRLDTTVETLDKTAADLETERDKALEHLWESQVAQAKASITSVLPENRGEVYKIISEAADYLPSFELRNIAIAYCGKIGIEEVESFPVPDEMVASISPDMKTLAIGEGRDVLLIDLKTKNKRRIPASIDAFDYSLTFTPNGKFLIRGLSSERLEFVRVNDGKVIPTDASCFSHLSYHPVKDIVSINKYGKVKIVDIESQDHHSLPSWAEKCSYFAFSPKGNKIALVDASRRIVTVHEAQSGKLLHTLHQPPSRFDDYVVYLQWHPSETMIATGWRPLVLWDLETESTRIVDESITFQKIEFSSDGRFLATAGWSKTPISFLYDVHNGEFLSKLNGYIDAFSKTGNKFFSRKLNSINVSTIIDDRSHRLIKFYDNSKEANRNLDFHPNNRWCATTRDTGVYIIDLRNYSIVKKIPLPGASFVRWNSNGTQLLTSHQQGIWHWDWNEQEHHITVGPPRKLCNVNKGNLAYFEDKKIVVGDWGAFHSHHFDPTQEEFHFKTFSVAGNVAISPNSKYLALCDIMGGQQFEIWDLTQKEVIYRELRKGTFISSFLSNDTIFVTGNSSCRLIDFKKNKEIDSYDGKGFNLVSNQNYSLIHTNAYSHLIPTTRSKLTLLDHRDGLVPLAQFEMDQVINPIRISKNGKYIAAGSRVGGPVHIWDLDRLYKNLKKLGLEWDVSEAPSNELKISQEEKVITLNLGELDPYRRNKITFNQLNVRFKFNPNEKVGVQLAVYAWRVHKPQRAVEVYEKILKFDLKPEKRSEYSNLLAWWYAVGPIEIRNIDRSYELVQKAIELMPDSYNALNTLGVVQVKKEMWAEAKSTFEKSIPLATNEKIIAQDYYPYSIALFKLGEKDFARTIFDYAYRQVSLPKVFNSGDASSLLHLHSEAAHALGDTRPIPETLKNNDH